MFGEGAEQRRAGPYHLIHAGEQVVSGERDASALIWPIFSFNPALLMLLELGSGHKLTTGKPIYHPDDSVADISSDVGRYLVKQVPQAPGLMAAVDEEGGGSNLLAKQLDIKAKTDKQKEREARSELMRERQKKGRDTKRSRGTYEP
jgi:hypothetical protein